MKIGVYMASIEHPVHQLQGKLKNPKSLNRTLQILLSISTFSFLFLYSSCLFTYLNFLLLFSTCTSYFVSFYINRHSMFILCHFIIVFVILNSQTSPLIQLYFSKAPINYMKRGLNMAPIKHQNLQLPGKFKKPKSLNWTLQILLSIFIFLFLYLYASLIFTYLNSLLFLFSTCTSYFFSFYINRHSMFILCIVIIVFVTQGFGLFGRSASMTVTHDLNDEFDMKKKEEEEEEEGGGEEEDGYDGSDDNEMVSGESDERFEDFIKKMRVKMRTEALQPELLG